MSEEQKSQPQGDFFSNLMFGSPPMPPEQEKKDTAEPEGNEKSESLQPPESPEQSQSPDNKQPDQLESIFALVQSLGPVIDKLAPLAGAFSSYFSQNKKEDTTKNAFKNKNANK